MAESVLLDFYKTTLDYRTKVISIIFASGIAVAIPNVVSYFDNSSKAENERRKIELSGEYDRRKLEQEILLKKEEAKVKELELQIAKGSKYQDHIARFIEQAMTQDIDARIRFAEYFAAVSDEPDRWRGFLTSLVARRDDLDRKLALLALEQERESKDQGRIDSLLADIRKLEVQVNATRAVAAPAAETAKPRAASQARLLQVLGRPVREITGQDCQPPDEQFRSRLESANVGPFTVTMLKPAITSLKSILNDIQAADAPLYRSIGSLGALCVRYQRGSQNFSSHAFGTAIDLSVDGRIIPIGGIASGDAAVKLRKIADVFEKAGWLWGGSYRVPDPMHFEVGSDLFEAWTGAGMFEVASRQNGVN
jgi:hypothetical protein